MTAIQRQKTDLKEGRLMPKNTTDGTGPVATTPPTVPLVLQGKGGIGKSVVARWLVEFLVRRDLFEQLEEMPFV